MVEILTGMAADADYTLSGAPTGPGVGDDDALATAAKLLDRAVRAPGFGNARYARTLFEQAINRQAYRLSSNGGIDGLTRAEVSMVTSADLTDAAALIENSSPPKPAPT